MKLLGFEIWHDCPNQCEFCALGDLRKITTPQQKIQNINTLKSILKSIDISKYDELSLVGGELGYSIPQEVKDELLYLIGYIITEYIKENKLNKLYIMSSLMNGIGVIKDIIYKFKINNLLDKLSINTSYDTKWRFNSITKKIWEENINYIKEQGVSIHIETILTGDLIDKFLSNDGELLKIINGYNVDFIRPVSSHDRKMTEMPKNFFPERKKFFAFLMKLQQEYKDLFDKLLDMKMRASTIYVLPYNGQVIRDNEHNIEDINKELSPCGHSDVFKCYSDSDRCIICDIDKFRNKL